jgi:hypothetical protein
MSVYRGKLRIYDVIAGKTEAMAGDTFIDESEECFLAFQYTPHHEVYSKANPYMCFMKLLHRGNFHNCERAASLTAEGVEL